MQNSCCQNHNFVKCPSIRRPTPLGGEDHPSQLQTRRTFGGGNTQLLLRRLGTGRRLGLSYLPPSSLHTSDWLTEIQSLLNRVSNDWPVCYLMIRSCLQHAAWSTLPPACISGRVGAGTVWKVTDTQTLSLWKARNYEVGASSIPSSPFSQLKEKMWYWRYQNLNLVAAVECCTYWQGGILVSSRARLKMISCLISGVNIVQSCTRVADVSL